MRTTGLSIAWAFAICLIMSGQSVALASEQDPVAAALALCLEPPTQTEVARSVLASAGWQPEEDAAVSALMNAQLGFKFDATDPDYTFRNAVFMAGSILGNSALGDDQVEMTSGAHTLAVLGISEGTPYCVLTGPNEMLRDVLASQDFNPLAKQSTRYLMQAFGLFKNNHLLALARLELEEIEALLSTAPLEPEARSWIEERLSPAIVYLVPSELFQ